MSDTPQPGGEPSDPHGITPSDPRSGDRIAKLLARAGIASRREVERMIEEGRVKIGDQIITTPNTVLENLNGVTVDDTPIKATEAARLFAFHKPSGLLTAERDPAGRPTIYTALRNALPQGTPRLMPIGRLDLNTEGLLLLTNDGELKRAMELPSSGIPRTYRARTFGDITQTQLEDLIEGVEIDGIRYGKINANMERRTGRNQWVEMTITEGKNREVRRVLEYLGLQVSRLMRISYGPFQLLDLPRGAAVEIRQVDVERFCRGLKGGPMPLRIAPGTPRPAAKPPARPSQPRVEPQARPDRRAPRPQPDRGRSDNGSSEGWRPDVAPIEAPRAAPVRKRRDATTDALHHTSREARSAADRRAPDRPERSRSNRPYADRQPAERGRAERTGPERTGTARPRAEQARTGQARPERAHSDRPQSERPQSDRPRSERPYSGKPGAHTKGQPKDAPRPDGAPRKGPAGGRGSPSRGPAGGRGAPRKGPRP